MLIGSKSRSTKYVSQRNCRLFAAGSNSAIFALKNVSQSASLRTFGGRRKKVTTSRSLGSRPSRNSISSAKLPSSHWNPSQSPAWLSAWRNARNPCRSWLLTGVPPMCWATTSTVVGYGANSCCCVGSLPQYGGRRPASVKAGSRVKTTGGLYAPMAVSANHTCQTGTKASASARWVQDGHDITRAILLSKATTATTATADLPIGIAGQART